MYDRELTFWHRTQRQWEIDLVNQTIHFSRKGEEKVAIPKQKMIVAALEYAKELEQIV